MIINIPNGATIGEAMKLMFPNFEVIEIPDVVIMETHYPHPYCKMQFDRKYWDMPFGSKEN